MKNKLLLLIAALGLAGASVQANILISGIVDGTQSGGIPKALEIVALVDVPDLSLYWLNRDTNGDGPWDTPTQLPSVALNQGDFFYVAGNSGSETILNNFGFTVGFTNGILNQNGDDIIGLATGDQPSDVFDSIGVVGEGDNDFYQDSFAIRQNTSTTPTISATSGSNFTITAYSDAGLQGPNGFGTYAIPEPSMAALMVIGVALIARFLRKK